MENDNLCFVNTIENYLMEGYDELIVYTFIKYFLRICKHTVFTKPHKTSEKLRQEKFVEVLLSHYCLF